MSSYEKRVWRDAYDYHKQRLRSVRATLDNKPPATMNSLHLQVTRIQKENERQAAIDRENKTFLERLVTIKNSGGRVDHRNDDIPQVPSRFKIDYELKQKAIDRENQELYNRLQEIQPIYSRDEWERDFQKHLTLRESLREDRFYDYGYDYRDETDEKTIPTAENGEDDKKLPAIEEKKKQKEKKEKKESDNVKLPPIDSKDKKKEKGKEKDEKTDSETKQDADDLQKAIDGGDKDAVMAILAGNTRKADMKKLCDKYKEEHDKELMDVLKSTFGDDIEDSLGPLMTESSEFDAQRLHDSIKGVGTDEDLLIEILCTRTPTEITEIKKAYEKKYERSLEEDIKGDTGGDFEDFLIKLCQASRSDSDKVDKEKAKKDAKALFEAGEKKWGTDESVFIDILTTRSFAQLEAIMAEYKVLAGKELEESLEDELEGDLLKGVKKILHVMKGGDAYYVDKLHAAVTAGDSNAVLRILVSKQKSLEKLKADYKKKHKSNLGDDVESKCKGDARPILLEMVGKGNSQGKNEKKSDSKKEKAGAGKDPAKQTKKDEKKAATNKDKKDDKGSKKDSKEEVDPVKAADELTKAVKASDKEKVLEILASCSRKEKLSKLSEKYKEKNDKDLFIEVKTKFGEDIAKTLEGIMMSPEEYEAHCINEAVQGLGTDEDVLVQILCTRSNADIEAMKKAYEKKYDRKLEDDIKGDSSGEFEDLLVKLAQGQRSESAADAAKAKEDAELLYAAGEKKWGTDESQFIEILTTRSTAHLQAVFEEYKKLSGISLTEALEKEMSGDLLHGFTTIVACIQNGDVYFVEKLGSSITGSKADTLRRLVFTKQAELPSYRSQYKEKYNSDALEDFDAKFEGDSKKILRELLSGGGGAGNGQKKDQKQQGGKQNGKTQPPRQQSKTAGNKQDNKTTTKKDKKEPQNNKGQTKDNQGGKKGAKPEAKKDSPAKKKTKAEEEKDKSDKKKGGQGTIAPAANFNSDKDAENIKNAMKGFGTDEEEVIDIIVHRSNAQRQEIRAKFQQKYEKDLMEELKSELRGDFEEAVIALMLPPQTYDALSLNQAMAGAGTDESALIEIICTRDDGELEEIKSLYKDAYGKDLVDAVKDDTEGPFRDLLVKLVQSDRNSAGAVDKEEVKKDAKELHQAFENDKSFDTNKFNQIMSTKSVDHLKAMFEEFKTVSGQEITEALGEELSGDFEKGVVALVESTRNPIRFFASRIRSATSGMGTDDKTLIRCIVSQAESNLGAIKSEFSKKFGKSLREVVDDECSGDYKKLLLAVIGS